MMRRRFRKRRAQWCYADNGAMFITDTASGDLWTANVLVPPSYVQYLCNTRKTDHLTIKGILLWLNVYVKNSTEVAIFGPIAPALDLYVIKSAVDSSNVADVEFLPYVQPPAPNAYTGPSWPADDYLPSGLDPFMWTTRLWPLYERGERAWPISWSGVNNAATAVGPFEQNNSARVGSTAVDGYWAIGGRHVQDPYQPSVRIKTRRRLERNQGLTIGMHLDGVDGQLDYFCRWACRILA